ncbi:MAG TPA: hypothetical protein VG897_02455, partial [Terriglobales bacterium]|nr:hypothetical protein [Terriglobales bacterium]
TVMYMPILKTKKGEWEALKHLDEPDRKLTFPLIECTTLVLNSQQPAAEHLKEHIDSIAVSMETSGAKQRTFGIDTSALLPTMPKQAKLLVSVCRRLTQKGLKIAPCILPQTIAESPTEVAEIGQYEHVILRIAIFACLPTQIDQLIKDAWAALANRRVRLHVLLDMHDLAGGDAVAIAASRKPYAIAALASGHAHAVALAGGAFPYFLTGIPQGQTKIQRLEWLVWRDLTQVADLAGLRFGDYPVTNPRPLEAIDPRKVSASAAIRYAREDYWLLLKAGVARKHGYNQYNTLSKLLITDSCYSGKTFSYGDERYHYHAQPDATSGNLWTWRRDATSHHLVLTAREIAKLHAL